MQNQTLFITEPCGLCCVLAAIRRATLGSTSLNYKVQVRAQRDAFAPYLGPEESFSKHFVELLREEVSHGTL